MTPRANKSDVWINFEKLSATQARCKHCSKVLAVSGGVTSSMHGHIRSKHPSLVPSSSSQSASPSPTLKTMFTQRTCSDTKQEKISDALAKFIAENMLPIAIVESNSLRKLMELLEPQYKVPCRQTMTNRLDGMKAKMTTTLATHLATEVEHIAVTTDIWTSISNDAYLSFTASYIDNDWSMKTPVLATVPMHERHTQTVIAAHLGDVANEWNVSEKIVACVHDGAANIRDAGGRNNWTDLHCAAHKLQLCITASMGMDKVSSHPISKCVSAAARLVGHFAHSPMAVGELMKKQAAMNPEEQPRKLIQHCKTRWNSVFDMFQRLVDLRWPVCAVLSDRNIVKLSDAKTLELRDEHWQLMADLLPVLKPLQIATSVMSTECTPSASTLYPMLWGVVNNHLTVTDEDSATVSTFKQEVSNSIKQRFGLNDQKTATNVCVIASVLDPKFSKLTGTFVGLYVLS